LDSGSGVSQPSINLDHFTTRRTASVSLHYLVKLQRLDARSIERLDGGTRWAISCIEASQPRPRLPARARAAHDVTAVYSTRNIKLISQSW